MCCFLGFVNLQTKNGGKNRGEEGGKKGEKWLRNRKNCVIIKIAQSWLKVYGFKMKPSLTRHKN